MDRAKAKTILAKELTEFAARPYDKLVASITHAAMKNVVGEPGANYQIEIKVLWDSMPNDNLRIMASIDDAGWRACFPLTDSLIVKPDGALL